MKLKIGQKIAVLVLLVTLISLAITSGIAFFGMGRIQRQAIAANEQLGQEAATDSSMALEQQAKAFLSDITKEKAKKTEMELEMIQKDVKTIADIMTRIYSNPSQYTTREVQEPIWGNKDLAAQLLFSSSVADKEDTALQQEIGYAGNISDILMQININDPFVAATYVASKNGFVIMADSNSSQKFFDDDPQKIAPFEAFSRPWYQKASSEKTAVFTDIIYDIHGGGACIIGAAPYYQNDEFLGVAGVGSFLTQINKIVFSTKMGETGYAFILNQDGKATISPKESGELAVNPADGIDIRDSSNLGLAKIAEKMVNGESGIAEVTIDGRSVYLAYEPLAALGWSFATAIEKDEVLTPAVASQQDILAITAESGQRIHKSIVTAAVLFVAAVIGVIILIIVMSVALSNRLVHPIKQLTDGVRDISRGNLDLQLKIHTGDEIESLAISFNAMAGELQEYIRNLSAVTADKERIATELNVATQIQTSMLPCIFPAFPEQREFDIYAMMKAAKEVGGDFYDFYLIDKTHLGIVMADVSGKGVPAALFMVIAKTLIKNYAQLCASPAEVFELVNTQLCENNEAGMFVTAFMGVLEIETGRFTYVNAGHNPPLLSRAGQDFEWFPVLPGFILAGIEHMKYTQQEITLNQGDRLFLYTDGVTEALNEQQELYSDERLLKYCNSGALDHNSVKEMLANIQQSVAIYAGEAEQADDITLLMLQIQSKVPKTDGGSDGNGG